MSTALPASLSDCPAGPLASLSQLLPVLLNHILCYLSLTEKVTQLTHLTRIFPPLAPSAFRADTLTLHRRVCVALSSAPGLLRVLSHVRGVLLDNTDPDFALPSASTPLSLPECFPHIRLLALDGVGLEQAQHVLSQLSADGAFAELDTLRYCVSLRYRPQWLPTVWPLSALSPIAHLPRLRTLVMCLGPEKLDYPAYRHLCSLPLTHLDLGACYVAAITATEAVYPPPSDTWRTVRLPESGAGLPAQMIQETLLPYIAAPSALHSLSLLAYSAQGGVVEGLGLSALSQSLISLELVACTTVSLVPRYLLSVDLCQPLLPHLCHFRLTGTSHEQPTATEAEERSQQWQHFLRVYRPLLRCLHLQLALGSSYLPIVHTALSCVQLRKCDLRLVRSAAVLVDPVQQLSAPAYPRLAPLPHLHTLRLAAPLTIGELSSVLAACSALDDLQLTINRTSSLTTAPQLLPLVARHCHSLRVLKIFSVCQQQAESEEDKAAQELAQCFSVRAQRPFSHLSSLSIAGHNVHWSAATVCDMVSLLEAAPLLYLNLLHAPLEVLPLFSPLTQLRSLRAPIALSIGNVPAACVRFFQAYSAEADCHQCGGLEEVERRVCGRDAISDEGVVSNEQLAADGERLSPADLHLFVRQPLFDGRDGRDAFMRTLSSLLRSIE